jgi:hypothetical protein
MTMTDELSGIFHVVVVTAEGRVVEYDGNAEEIDSWLAEFRSADTLVQVDVHELAVDEAFGIWDSPGTSPEGDF